MSGFESCLLGNSAPTNDLAQLAEDQSQPGRHRCAICSYVEGFYSHAHAGMDNGDTVECAHGNSAPRKVVVGLHRSQSGRARHKCVVCAYALGASRATDFGRHDPTAADTPFRGRLVLSKPDRRRHPFTGARYPQPPGTRDYSATDARNRALGLAGELQVLSFEKDRLTCEDRPDLAAQVEHTAVEVGDHCGYDILSYERDGRERYIEVKTTVGPASTPFFISANELQTAAEKEPDYQLYRVFSFDVATGAGQLYIEPAPLDERFALTATNFRAEHR